MNRSWLTLNWRLRAVPPGVATIWPSANNADMTVNPPCELASPARVQDPRNAICAWRSSGTGELKFLPHTDGFNQVCSWLIRYDHANST